MSSENGHRQPVSQNRRILAFAYACEPNKGSEPGAGWAWARMLARLGETWVVTRANNREAIEAALPDIPERDRLHFVYVDLPHWLSWWKRGQRGIRLYYLLWQIAAAREVSNLRREVAFDLAWHLTFANAWFGSLVPLTRVPFVYGPVGGGVGIPWRLLPALGAKGVAYEMTRSFVRAGFRYFNPLARLAWRRACLVLVQNEETKDWLPRRHRGKAVVFPNPVVEAIPSAPRRPPRRDDVRTALFAGRLLPGKGAWLAVRAVALRSDWRLLVCGEGPDEERLRSLTCVLGVEERVRLLGWRPREDVLRLMCEEADLLLFPSLHDEAGWAVVEAGACGLPVICLDRGGPRELVGEGDVLVPATRGPRAIAAALAHELPGVAHPFPRRVAERRHHFAIDTRTAALAAVLAGRVDSAIVTSADEETRR